MKKYLFVALISIIIGFFLGVVATPEKIVKETEVIEIRNKQTVTVTPNCSSEPAPTVTTTATVFEKNPAVATTTNPKEGFVTIVPEQYFWYINKKIKWEKIQIPKLEIPETRRHPFEMGVEGYSWAAFSLMCKNNNAGKYDGVDRNFLDSLQIKKTDIVADIGAGTGKYTFALADRAKKVYANDLGPSFPIMIDWVNQLSANGFFEAQCGQDRKNYTNIIAYVGDINDAKLPKKCNLILLHQVHAFICKPPSRTEEVIEDRFLKSLVNKLKDDGRIVIVEHKKEVKNQRTDEETISFFTQKKFKLNCKMQKYPGIPDRKWNIFYLTKIR